MRRWRLGFGCTDFSSSNITCFLGLSTGILKIHSISLTFSFQLRSRLFGVKHLPRRSDTIPEAFISLANYLLIRILFRVPLGDFQNVTIYPTKWVQSIKYEANSSFVNPEGLIKSYWCGKSIVEVPISFIARKKGRSTGTKPKMLINAVKNIFAFYIKWVLLGERGKVTIGKIIKDKIYFA